jgi:PAS domain S-box-containing protein
MKALTNRIPTGPRSEKPAPLAIDDLTVRGEENLLQILNHLPDGVVVLDRAGRLRYLNPAAERITGLSSSEAKGSHCREIFKRTTCKTHSPSSPDGRSALHADSCEFSAIRMDGKEVSIISSISPLRDLHGTIIGSVQVFKDISDRKRLEDDLRLSEGKYRAIFEGSRDMIFITDREGRVKDVNQAGVELLGYEGKEVLMALRSIEAVYDKRMHWQVFKKQIDLHGFVKDFEAVLRKKDGVRLHCLLSGNAIQASDGEIVGYEGIVKDITARMDAVRTLKQRHLELSLLNGVAHAMNAREDLDDVLSIALTRILEVLNLSAGGIFLIDHEKSTFSMRVQQGLQKTRTKGPTHVRLQDELLQKALLKRDHSFTPQPTFPPFGAVFRSGRYGEAKDLTCFLIMARERASGFFGFEIPQRRQMGEQDLHLLGSLGNFVGGSVENARLVEAVRTHREELKVLTATLMSSQEAERKRIARELHDEAGQALIGINLTIEELQESIPPDLKQIRSRIREIKGQINRTYKEMRRISHRLHPSLLTDLGLEPALESYLADISKKSGLDIEIKMVGFEKRLNPDVETALFRITQEAISNTLKHSHAKHFKLSIVKGYPNIVFSAEDDGGGFDGKGKAKARQALGLLCMRERAAMLGGRLFLRSSKGSGTKIRIEIPIHRRSDQA